MLIDDRSVQRALAAIHLYSGEIDGNFGPKSQAAARTYASRRAPEYKVDWPNERVRLAVEQAMFKDLGFYSAAIDGIAGNGTRAALEKWQDHITFTRPSPAPDAGVKAATVWPLQRDCLTFYGTPDRPATGWEIVKVTMPYERKLAWALDTKVTKAPIHAKCKDAYLAVHEEILAHYGLDAIQELGIDLWGGTVAVRKMRNGSSWSMHAFGCAEDLDPARNQLRETRATARFAKPEYAPMLDIWEKHGAISLGRARDFDWMHFQFARL